METFLVILGIVGVIFSVGFNIWAWFWDVPNTLERAKYLREEALRWDARAKEELEEGKDAIQG